MLHDDHRWRGTVTVRAVDAETGAELDRASFPNLITDAGLNLLRDALGDGTDARIRYLAVGAGATPPDASDTALEDERLRRQVTLSEAPATGELETIVYLAPADATGFTIEELGWFAGPDASSESGSGTLLARVLYSREKTDLESLQVDRLDTIGRA